LFLDTGVGKSSFNIISQGEISRILSTSPIERRGVIEEFKTCLYILLKYGKVGEGYTVRDLVKDVGSWMRDRIRAGIDEKMFEPNAPMTIAIKGFDQRLFEKGTLYNAIKYRSKKAKVEG
jgi:hypothetical protein